MTGEREPLQPTSVGQERQTKNGEGNREKETKQKREERKKEKKKKTGLESETGWVEKGETDKTFTNGSSTF